MSWGSLATQFCLELAFGVLLGLCLLHRAPLGLFFHRMMGSVAALPLIAAVLLPPLSEGASWSRPLGIAAGAALLSFPWLIGRVKSTRRRAAAVWASACTGLALVFAVDLAPGVDRPLALAVGSLSAMATGVVAGGVGLAMVVGHWYLTVPDLPVSLLQRLNRLTAIAILVSGGLIGITCLVNGDALAAAERPLTSPFGIFSMAARVSVGLAMPLLFAWMTAGSLKYRNTRSATGILYASTVLVLIGAAVSLSLQDSYGIPL